MVSGVANKALTRASLCFGNRYGAYVLLRDSEARRPQVLVGRDTDLRAYAGSCSYRRHNLSVGANVLQAGVLPTPGVAYLAEGGK